MPNLLTFSTPSGAWMLGPSQRCRAEPITSLKSHLNVAIYVHLTKGNQPLSDADNFLRILSKFEEGIDTYKSNLQRGVKSGMVRSTSECLQGIDCMRQWYPFLSSSKSAKNIFRWYTSNRLQNFVSRLSPEELSQWTAKHGKNISRSLLDGVIKFVGKPLVRLFEYLENNYTLHCVPDNVSSGMFARPVDHVYVNGTRTAEETNPTLADGQNIINGKQAYASVLSYFTTTNLTAGEERNKRCRVFELNFHTVFVFWFGLMPPTTAALVRMLVALTYPFHTLTLL